MTSHGRFGMSSPEFVRPQAWRTVFEWFGFTIEELGDDLGLILGLAPPLHHVKLELFDVELGHG